MKEILFKLVFSLSVLLISAWSDLYGQSFNVTVDKAVNGTFRDSLASGYFKVMAECAPQYNGVSPSDMSLDAYFAVAEKLDIPVGIHMGTGGIHAYIKRIVQAGFEKRIMYGTDFMMWPKLLETSIGVIENASS